MKISDLLITLNELEYEHGDIEVSLGVNKNGKTESYEITDINKKDIDGVAELIISSDYQDIIEKKVLNQKNNKQINIVWYEEITKKYENFILGSTQDFINYLKSMSFEDMEFNKLKDFDKIFNDINVDTIYICIEPFKQDVHNKNYIMFSDSLEKLKSQYKFNCQEI